MIHGNTAGIKQTILDELEALYAVEPEADNFLPPALVETVCALSERIHREISVYLSRDGRVVDVSVGDAGTVPMTQMRLMRNADRLCGVRCLHTHPSGNGRLSDVDIGTLKSLKLDSMCAVGILGGKPNGLFAAFIHEAQAGGITVYGPLSVSGLPHKALLAEIAAADERLKLSTVSTGEEEPRAILIGLEDDFALDELSELARTASVKAVARVTQRRDKPDVATYIGKGKAEALALEGSARQAELFLFDDELTPTQLRNLEAILGARVVDRTALILDIFASRAQKREAKLQVELAQWKYRLPRLSGQGGAMSRQGAGVLARGGGEQKLELDRRRVRRRVFELEQEIELVAAQRALRRKKREKNAVPVVAIVGYTNAGKSTLLNLLSDADVLAEDKLFATLDPVTRGITLPDGRPILITDTVGFIQKLPHELVDAFRSTLEEVVYADLILHVVDATASDSQAHMQVVDSVLGELGAGDHEKILVYNKMDSALDTLERSDAVYISALKNRGVDKLLARIAEALGRLDETWEMFLPYSRGDVLSYLQRHAHVLEADHLHDGTRIVARAQRAVRQKADYMLNATSQE